MSELFYLSKFSKKFPQLVMLESRRKGGVSHAPYQSLNLGLNTQDESSHVQQNRKIFWDAIGVFENQIVGGTQIHQAEVLAVDEGMFCAGYDAFITNQKNLFLTIGVADCTPVLIYDSRNQAVGAAHAGWRGTVGHIVQNVISQMESNYGTQAADCYAFIGTCIDVENFEVGEEVAKQFDEQFVVRYAHQEKPHVDLKRANLHQLIQMGVPESQIEISPYSTVFNNDLYFSYRKENGLTGRMLAVIGVKDL